MIPVEDEHPGIGLDFGFRKATSDKLNWKNEIQKRLDICIATYGTREFFKSVRRLVKSIIFDIRGYRFKPDIEKKISDLQFEKAVKQRYYEITDPSTWFHPLKRGILLLDLNQEYYDTLYDFLVQMIAAKGLLMDTEVYVPMRVKKNLSESYGQSHLETPTDSPYE